MSEKIVFTNGCFDFVHPGHVWILKGIKEIYPDFPLVVGINSDESIKRLKGNNRPIYPEADRVLMLESLVYVDKVVVFQEDTPLELIKQLKPTVLVKGMDYVKEDIVGADLVDMVSFVKLKDGYSTTSLIKYIKAL